MWVVEVVEVVEVVWVVQTVPVVHAMQYLYPLSLEMGTVKKIYLLTFITAIIPLVNTICIIQLVLVKTSLVYLTS